MRRMQGSGLCLLASLIVGFCGVSQVTQTTYRTPEPTPISDFRTPLPTYDMTPPGVEGDDGSLGGPVYDQHHQSTGKPHYVFKEPISGTSTG